MGSQGKVKPLTASQQRLLKLLFKFRFVSSHSLAQAMNINRRSVYESLEKLTPTKLIIKVYSDDFRIDRKPAYYYLSKSGVTTVRKLMDVRESVVHALYKNDTASEEFIQHCLTLITVYAAMKRSLPDTPDIFTKTEINRFEEFPKNRPDLYVRMPDDKGAMVVLADSLPPWLCRKRLEEIITHSEEEGWYADYPKICFILNDERRKLGFLASARRKLDDMGYDEDELTILATSLHDLQLHPEASWSSTSSPKQRISLF
jgi:predicted transcriptional regulator